MLKKTLLMILVVLSVPLYAAAASLNLPKSGQDLCYDTSLNLLTNVGVIPCAGTGQDGETQIGSPPVIPRFTDNGNGTVTDNQSGLTWLKDMKCTALNPPGGHTWSEALTLVNALAAPACGLSDGSIAGTWHLPNVNELESLVDLSQAGPAMPLNHPFTNFTPSAGFYWSSTITPIFPSNAEAVDMYTSTLRGDVKTVLKSVWAVKDTPATPKNFPQTGQTLCWNLPGIPVACPAGADGIVQSGVALPAAPRFTDNADGTLTDKLTGLIWLKQADCLGNPTTQQAALNAANALTSGTCGLSDGTLAGEWRLPNRNEMRTLINYDQVDGGAWLLTQGFTSLSGKTITGWYWSSDSYASIVDNAHPLARNLKWMVKTEGGTWTNEQVDIAFPTDPKFALAVRGALKVQRITFGGTVKTLADSPVDLSTLVTGKGGSPNPVTFTYVSGPGTLTGNSLALTGLGTIVITANQAGNGVYYPAANTPLTITVAPTFTVSFVAGAHGSLTGTASQTVVSGASTTAVTAVPAAGYHFVQWSGAAGFTSTANPLTLTNVTANQTLTASFANTFNVSFVAGAHGSLTGTASQSVVSGASATPVTAVPAAGYHFVQWSGAGGFTSTANPLTLANVTADQTLTASFAIDTFSVSFAAGAHGSLTGTVSQTVASGASATPVTAVPATGYHFVQWSGTGGFTSTANPLTLTNVTANQTLTASFALTTFNVSFVAGAHGSLTGTASQTVASGASATPVTAVPATGYHFVQWSGAGGFTSTANPLTLANVAADQTLTANFATDTFLVTASAPGGNGSISCTSPVNYGSNCICTVTPGAGYHLMALTDNSADRLSVVSGTTYTISNVTGSHAVSATFARPTGILTPVAGKASPDITDALAVLKLALRINQPTAADIARADVAPLGADGRPSGDGQLDVYDVIGVLRMLLGIN